MIKSAKFKVNYRCFKKGDSFEFRPGLNLLVGDQGSGKSTVLGLLDRLSAKDKEAAGILKISTKPVRIISFDFEKDNPRAKNHIMDGVAGMFQLQGMFQSHGEVIRDIITNIPQLKEPTTFLLDEPDTGLSPRSIHVVVRLFQELVEKGGQILASSHNPLLIESADRVLDFEKRAWTTPEDFLHSQSGGSSDSKSGSSPSKPHASRPQAK